MSFRVREWCVYGRLPDDSKRRFFVTASGVISAMNNALVIFPEGSRILRVVDMSKPFVFHLKREYFDLIKSGSKSCEYRFKIPKGLSCGSLIRFDLGYKPLSDSSAHLFARCTGVVRTSLLHCPQYFYDCFGITPEKFFDYPSIYKISFVLQGREVEIA